jgi:hypothetical protein
MTFSASNYYFWFHSIHSIHRRIVHRHHQLKINIMEWIYSSCVLFYLWLRFLITDRTCLVSELSYDREVALYTTEIAVF